MKNFCGNESAPYILVTRNVRFSNAILFLCIVNIAAAIVSTTGNLLVMIATSRTPSLHRPSFVLLSGLALSDLAVGLISQPLFVVTNMADFYKNCNLLSVSYRVYEYFANQLLAVTFLTLSATAVDRFLALKIHLRYQELVTVRKTLLCLLFMWITATFYAAWKIAHRSSAEIGGVMLCLGLLFVVLSCYLKIFRIVRHHQTLIENQIPQLGVQGTVPNMARYRRSVRSMLYVAGFFCLSCFPWVVLGIIKHAIFKGSTVETVLAARISFTVSCLNSCLNPFLYCWRMEEIRQAVKEQLRKLCVKSTGN